MIISNIRHLSLEIVEATEAAAIAAAKYVGSGDKLQIDKVATEAMRDRLNNIQFIAEIAIGEGEKDKSIGLYEGERVGSNRSGRSLSSNLGWDDLVPPDNDPRWVPWKPEWSIAVDPVDGTTQTAKGGYEAMSVIVLGKHDCLFKTETYYMNKIAVGKIGQDISTHLDRPVEDVVAAIRQYLGKKQITVCILDRPRHAEMVARLRAVGCRIKFIQDCDVSGAIAPALPDSGIDLFVGVGGAPEGVITAAAIKCLGGYFEGQLVDDKTFKPIDKNIYDYESLARGDVMFAATGITQGGLLNGVRHQGKGVITHSILMESASKTFKKVESYYEI